MEWRMARGLLVECACFSALVSIPVPVFDGEVSVVADAILEGNLAEYWPFRMSRA